MERAGKREHVRHIFGELFRHIGVVHRRPAIGQSNEYIIVVEQLVHCLNRAWHVGLTVLDDVFDPAAVHTAFGVRVIEYHADCIRVIDPLKRAKAG